MLGCFYYNVVTAGDWLQRAIQTTQSKPDPAESRCQAAKSKREAKLRAVGLKRTFDLLRQLDEAV